jgi:serpin B
VEENLFYGKMHKTEVEVFLPRFKMEENYDVQYVLIDLGMVHAFEQARADFSGISSKKELYFSKVILKPFVEVTEKGTEATSAITVTMKFCPLSPQIPLSTFCANHPFLFFIQNSKTNDTLFYRRLYF